MALKPSNGVALLYSSRYTARTIYAGAGLASPFNLMSSVDH